jgi:hypothetical protein
MPPQSTVVLVNTLPATHALAGSELLALEDVPLAEDDELLDELCGQVGASGHWSVLLPLLLLLLVTLLELEHIGVFQLAGLAQVASHGTGPQHADEPPLQPELLLDEVGLELLDEAIGPEHSFTPPATLPPKVASLHAKLPINTL